MARIVDIIKSRRSVRTFEDRQLMPENRAYVEDVIQNIETPFGVPMEFRLLGAAEHGLKSPVIVGAHDYVAAKVKRVQGAELSLGFAFETFCLRVAECGLGTVMLAASLSRKSFEEAMEVGPGEVMPVASPVGYPAAKMSLREGMMRKAIKSDERLPFSQVFFRGSFGTPLSPGEAVSFEAPLQMLRLAPSATNKQPWRAVVDGNAVHFFEEHGLKESALGDIQKVDMGIALSHFWLTAQEQGLEGRFVAHDPNIATPKNTEYITSFEAVL